MAVKTTKSLGLEDILIDGPPSVEGWSLDMPLAEFAAKLTALSSAMVENGASDVRISINISEPAVDGISVKFNGDLLAEEWVDIHLAMEAART